MAQIDALNKTNNLSPPHFFVFNLRLRFVANAQTFPKIAHFWPKMANFGEPEHEH
jgi:hypothetical protein